MTGVLAQAIEELSAAALAREVGCHVGAIVRLFERGEVPGAYQTDGRQWRCPRWCWLRYQAVRAGLDGDRLVAAMFATPAATGAVGEVAA